MEINASSVNRVEDIRKLIAESMLTLPVFSRFKVFIIDECHRVTVEAQNALLKVLEDVPRHLAVIFATTEPDKLLPTLVSRCQLKIEVRRQTVQSMTDILMRIAKSEGLVTERRALQLISKKGGCIPRDCINLLEDVALAYDGSVTSKNVLERTGEADTSLYFSFIMAAHSGLTDILTFMSEFTLSDVSYRKFLSGLSRFAMDAIYVRMGISAEYDKSYLKELKKLFAMYKVDEFHKLLRLIDDAARRSPSEIGAAELALSVLALNIGEITAVVHSESAAEVVKVQAEYENSDGAQKFVEREMASCGAPAVSMPDGVGLDEFLDSIGAVAYG
jgi:DNA polymerase-3 subunit gamma/tau